MGFDDEAMPESDAMMSALIAAGTSAEATSNFVHRITGNENAIAGMEMYGQGSLVAEANKRDASSRSKIFRLSTFAQTNRTDLLGT